MLSRVSLNALVAVATAGGAGLCVMFMATKRKYRYHLSQRLVLEAAEEVRAAKPAMELLGDTFELGEISLEDGFSRVEPHYAQIKVPVRGPRDSGFLYAYAEGPHSSTEPRLRRIELTFNRIKNRRLAWEKSAAEAAGGAANEAAATAALNT